MSGLLERFRHRDDTTNSDQDAENLRLETAKVRAYRLADEVSNATKKLLVKAQELRAEIEAIDER